MLRPDGTPWMIGNKTSRSRAEWTKDKNILVDGLQVISRRWEADGSVLFTLLDSGLGSNNSIAKFLKKFDDNLDEMLAFAEEHGVSKAVRLSARRGILAHYAVKEEDALDGQLKGIRGEKANKARFDQRLSYVRAKTSLQACAEGGELSRGQKIAASFHLGGGRGHADEAAVNASAADLAAKLGLSAEVGDAAAAAKNAADKSPSRLQSVTKKDCTSGSYESALSDRRQTPPVASGASCCTRAASSRIRNHNDVISLCVQSICQCTAQVTLLVQYRYLDTALSQLRKACAASQHCQQWRCRAARDPFDPIAPLRQLLRLRREPLEDLRRYGGIVWPTLAAASIAGRYCHQHCVSCAVGGKPRQDTFIHSRTHRRLSGVLSAGERRSW